VKYTTAEKLNKFSSSKSTDGVLIKCKKRAFKDIKNYSDFKTYCNSQTKEKIVLILDRLNDSSTLSNIFRTAAFVGVNNILLSKHTKPSIDANFVKKSGGAVELYDLFTIKFIKKFLLDARKEGWIVIFSEVNEDINEDTKNEKQNEETNEETGVKCIDLELNALPKTIFNKNIILVISSHKNSHVSSSDYKVQISQTNSKSKADNLKIIDSLSADMQTGFILNYLKNKASLSLPHTKSK
jgi:tRNA G18 (ribose-2'-O)-methylase SpoU